MNVELNKQKINKYIITKDRLLHYIKSYQTYKSYDHADFKGLSLIIYLLKNVKSGKIFSKIILKLVYAFFYFFPTLARKISGIKPLEHAGGITILLSALIILYDLEPSKELAEYRDQTAYKLLEMAIDHGNYLAWGLEYDWFSFELIPARTPIGYTTCMASTALLELYRQTKDQKWLEYIQRACEFFFSGLNHQKLSENTFALSYTNLDNTLVVNSNALLAALLVEVYNVLKVEKYLDLALKLVNFVLASQNEDGSWFYAQEDSKFIDHYHTAMTIQGLIRVYKSKVGDKELNNRLSNSIIKATNFHLNYLFENHKPKISNTYNYPLSTILFMEDTILFDYLLDLSHELNAEIITKIKKQWIANIDYAIESLLNKNGSFTAIYYPIINNHFSMLRWSNAPMLVALGLTIKRFGNSYV